MVYCWTDVSIVTSLGIIALDSTCAVGDIHVFQTRCNTFEENDMK